MYWTLSWILEKNRSRKFDSTITQHTIMFLLENGFINHRSTWSLLSFTFFRQVNLWKLTTQLYVWYNSTCHRSSSGFYTCLYSSYLNFKSSCIFCTILNLLSRQSYLHMPNSCQQTEYNKSSLTTHFCCERKRDISAL